MTPFDPPFICNNKYIKGVNVGDYELKLSPFADDINLIVADTLSLRNAINISSLFYHASSLEINFEKTEVMQIGKPSILYRHRKLFKLKWTDEGVRSLGITYFQ